MRRLVRRKVQQFWDELDDDGEGDWLDDPPPRHPSKDPWENLEESLKPWFEPHDT